MLLFAQAAFATTPCMDAQMSAAAAIIQSQPGDCCETSVTEINLCVMKCTDSDKLAAHTPMHVAFASTEPVLTVDLAHDVLMSHRDSVSTAARDPPKTIRFCTLLI